jgi:uncharacterized protein (UPF0276 family)
MKYEMIGIGLRHKHYDDILSQLPDVGWLEIHTENLFIRNTNLHNKIKEIRSHYPLSFHGVGLSLGTNAINREHLFRIKELISEYQPFMISEHLSWSVVEGIYIPDLLPIAYTDENIKNFSDNISISQEYLGKQMLIENPSTYLEYSDSKIREVDFLLEICTRAKCKILLDVNNIFVSCFNHKWDIDEYINSIPRYMVGEIHLSGHSLKNLSDGTVIRIDSHDDFVSDEVWEIYKKAIDRFGNTPTLLEWDDKIPDLEVLIKEAKKALLYL